MLQHLAISHPEVKYFNCKYMQYVHYMLYFLGMSVTQEAYLHHTHIGNIALEMTKSSPWNFPLRWADLKCLLRGKVRHDAIIPLLMEHELHIPNPCISSTVEAGQCTCDHICSQFLLLWDHLVVPCHILSHSLLVLLSFCLILFFSLSEVASTKIL